MKIISLGMKTSLKNDKGIAVYAKGKIAELDFIIVVQAAEVWSGRFGYVYYSRSVGGHGKSYCILFFAFLHRSSRDDHVEKCAKAAPYSWP